MALPELPDEGQDPWYDDREAFDAEVRGMLEGPLSEIGLSARFDQAKGTIAASSFGVVSGTGTAQNAALHAAFAAAEAAGGGYTIQLPPGPITIDGHFSMAGYSSGMVGATSSMEGASTPRGTGFVCINQDGPVLDYTGFIWPYGMLGVVEIGNFTVEGDGTADATTEHGYGGATKQGIRLGNITGSPSSDPPVGVSVHDIVITKTGGVPFYAKDTYLSDFRNIIASHPINAKANNVPYHLHVSCNGNRFYGLGCRSLLGDADCGVGGAVVAIPSESFQYHNCVYYGTWFENLHAPTNGTFFSLKTNGVILSDTQFFDCFKESGATGTSRFRLETDPLAVAGGNIIRGVIPGKGSDALSTDVGVAVMQNNNLIEGVRGFRDTNVTIAAGVTGTTVRLGGSFSGVPGAAFAVVDSSGNTSNTIIDEYSGRHVFGSPAGTVAVMRVNGVDLPHLRSSVSLASSGNPNMTGGVNSFRFTLTGNVTMGAPSNIQDKPLYLAIIQDATGSRTVTWNATYKFPSGTPPVLSTAPGKVDRLTFEWSGTAWECIAVQIGL